MPVIPALARWGPENHKLKVILRHLASVRSAWVGYMRFHFKRKFQLRNLVLVILQNHAGLRILNFEAGLTSLAGHLLPPGCLLFSLQAGEIHIQSHQQSTNPPSKMLSSDAAQKLPSLDSIAHTAPGRGFRVLGISCQFSQDISLLKGTCLSFLQRSEHDSNYKL